MASTQDLLKELSRFKNSAEGKGYELRLGLADIVMRQLDIKGWSQKQLAEAAGMKESFITRVVHAKSNCTFSVVGRLLDALGVDADIRERIDHVGASAKNGHKRISQKSAAIARKNGANGHDISRSKARRRNTMS